MAKVSVSKYVRNVGKSLGYAAIESMGDSANTIKSYIESIDEGYNKIYTTISQKIENRDKRSFKEKVKSSALYKSVDDGFKNLQEDIKTGNWFNKDRVNTVEDDLDSMLGSTADIGFIGGGFVGSSSSSSSSNSSNSDNYDSYDNNSSILSSSSMSPESMISAAYQSQTMTKTGEFIVKGNKANTQILMSHLSDINTRVIGSIGTVYSEVKATNQFLNTNILKHIEDTHKYQEETHTYQENALKQLNTLASSIDDLVSIQKSLYKPEKKYGSSSFKKLSDYLSYTGSIDFEEYLKLVKSNIKDALNFGGILSMASMGIGGAKSEAKKVIANPIGSLLTFLGGLIFKNTKSAMEKFNTSLENFFPNFISKLNKNSSNPWISTIAKIFGLKSPDDSASIDISNYEKGPVPFDGITRKTIIEVIPGYLARIESAITGNEERYFDNKTAKWVYSSKISKNFANERNDIIASANSKINDNMESLYKTAHDNGGEKQEKALRKKIDNMIKIIYKDKGKFIGSIDKGWKYYGFDSPEEFRLVKNALSRETITKIAKENIEAREKLAERYKEIEQSPGLYATLFNDTFANPDDKEDRWNKSAKNPSNFKKNTGLLVNTVDSYGKNVFYYLREILNSINNNWRKSRGGRYNKPNPKGPKGGPGVSPSSKEGSSSDSSESSSDDDGSGLDWDYLKKRQEEEKKENGETEKVDRDTIVSRFIKKVFGDKGEQVYNKILDVFNTPVNFVTKLIEKADNSLFNLMFGDGEYYDSEGNRVDSAFDYMIDKITVGIKKMVENVTGFFRDTIYKKYLQPFFEKYIKPITTEAGNIIKKGAGYVKDTASSVFSDIKKKFSRQAKNMEDGGVSSADDFENEATDDNGINTSAHGRIATKRGLTMISPGEIIIPATFDKNKQNKMEKEERKDRDRIADMIALNAKGNFKEKNEENLKRLKEFFSNIVGDSYNHTSKILAGGLVGGGAGLLAGNPFLGVLAGTALSIINSSETLKTMLLGKEVVNDDGTKSRKGGLIPKKLIDIFSKALPDMGKFGLVGGVAGLFTGFGPIGGAAIGVATSVLKNDEKFNNFLFGENGLFKKDWVKKVEKTISKAAPNIAIGTGLGLLAGPFGLLGNAVVGASVGLLSSTDKFQKFMFGDPDHPEKNSVMKIINKAIIIPGKEKIKEMLDAFKEYTQKNVLDPLKNFWDPFKQAMKNTVNSIADGIKDATKNMLENTIGLPAADFLQEKIFKPLGTFISIFVKNPLKVLGMTVGSVATLPFRALGGIGNRIRIGQIRKGKAYDMSAEERLNYRTEYADNKLINRFLFGNKKKGTTGLTGFIGKRKIIPENIKNAMLGGLNNLKDARDHGGLFSIWKDRAYDQDVTLSKMSNEELDALLSGTGSLINSEEELQTRIGSIKNKMSANISELFNKRDEKGKNLYDKLGFDYANKVMELAASGDMEGLNAYLNTGLDGLSKKEQASVKNSILQILTNDNGINDVRAIKSLRDSINNKRTDNGEIEKKLSEAFGKNIKGKKGLRSIYNSVQAELNARRKGEFIEEEKTPEEETNENINNGFDTVKKSFDEVTNNLNSIKNTIVDSAKEICYTIDPSLRPKNEPSKENPIINTVNNIRNTSENADHKDDVYDQTTGNFVPKDKNDSAYKENEQEREDIKEEESKNKEDEKEKRSKLNDFIDILIGKKKDRDKSRTGVSGIIGKIMSLRNAWDKQKSDGILGKVFKIGKKVVGGALIVSFLGYASQFIKTAIWPKIQTLLFGSEKEDGTRSGGLLGGLKNLIVGKDGKSGVLGSILGWFGEKFNSIAKWYRDNGGLGGLLTGAIEKIIVGQGYAIENIVAPIVSLLVQSLPSVIVGLVKGVLSGLKSILTGNSLSNKKLSANSGSNNLNISGIVNNIESSRTKTNNTLKSIMDNSNSSKNGKKLSSNLASIEKINKSSTSSSSSSINWTKELGISGGTYYNSKGEVVESNDTTKAGALWTREHINEIVTDENGNIANDYYVWNTDESAASKIVKATATGYRNALGNWGSGLLSTALSKISVSPIGKKLSTKAITGAAQVGAKAVGTVTSAGWNLGNKTRDGIVNFIKNSAENVAVNGSKTASGNVFTNLFKKLFGFIANSKIGQIIVGGFTKGAGTTALQNALNKCAEKLGKHCATKLVGKAAGKLASLLSNATPVGIALAVVDFLWGMSHAETILGVAKGGYDVNFGLRCICGLLNLLSNRFTLGLISPSFILDLFIDAILPYFGVDVSELTNARSTYNEVLNAWNKAHPEETYDNLEDFNKRSKAGFWTRLSTSVKNIFGAKDKEVEKVMSNAGITYTNSTTNSSTNNANVGFGRHLYQHDPSIAGMKYGNSTIAKAGCAPVAATNAIRNITGYGDLSHAAAYAEANGMVSPNGGTSMNYFNSYFRDNGISTTNTKNSKDVIDAVRSGHQVIMYGQDGSNDNTPFGTTPHFITATGIDKKGNIIIEDPDLPNESNAYNPRKVTGSMKSSIIINNKSLVGKGSDETDSSSTQGTANTFFSALTNLGTSMMKKAYGGLYDAIYGDGSETDTSNTSLTSTTTNNRSGSGGTFGSSSTNNTSSVDYNLSNRSDNSINGKTNEEKIWNYLRSKGYSTAGAAGIMGNLRMESNYTPYIVEGSQLSALGYPATNGKTKLDRSKEITADIQSGKFSKDKFVNTYFGYGLPQFTYKTWKQQLYENTVEKGKEIDSIANQLDYLTSTFEKYCGGLNNRLKRSTNAEESALDVFRTYEMPNWKSVKQYTYDNERKQYAADVFNRLAVGKGRDDTGLAQKSIDQYRTDENTTTTNTANNNSNAVDYTTFLNTIVQLLLKISTNTELLSKVLDILSNNFGIDIDKSDIDTASKKTRAEGKAALNELVRRTTGNNTNLSKLLNNQDTEYIISAMTSLAKE